MLPSLRLFNGVALTDAHGALVSGAAAQPRRLAVLALLAATWPNTVTRDRVIGLLWPDQDDAGAVRLHVTPVLDGCNLRRAPEFEHWLDDIRREVQRELREALHRPLSSAGRRGTSTLAALRHFLAAVAELLERPHLARPIARRLVAAPRPVAVRAQGHVALAHLA
ncbi:MAG TPA: hypothetical protein VFY16_01450, partial [Gemmatimonadaceae bacterium]|nr:hypothetical protein [Gemmatimonadaceae bacterium]